MGGRPDLATSFLFPGCPRALELAHMLVVERRGREKEPKGEEVPS